MTPYVLTAKLIDPHWNTLRGMIDIFVVGIPHRFNKPGDPLRCHELVRIVQRAFVDHGVFEEMIVDGKFGVIEHSWLRVERDVILDVYLPGALPQVVVWNVLPIHPITELYKTSAPRDDIRKDVIQDVLDALGVP
jgi:hypothetical protein